MSKTFRPWKIEEPLLLPVTVADFVPESHLARFVLSVVRNEVDLGKITRTYGSESQRSLSDDRHCRRRTERVPKWNDDTPSTANVPATIVLLVDIAREIELENYWTGPVQLAIDPGAAADGVRQREATVILGGGHSGGNGRSQHDLLATAVTVPHWPRTLKMRVQAARMHAPLRKQQGHPKCPKCSKSVREELRLLRLWVIVDVNHTVFSKTDAPMVHGVIRERR